MMDKEGKGNGRRGRGADEGDGIWNKKRSEEE